MSYINDALKKAQQEKDNLYGHYGGIISRLQGPRPHAGIKWLVAVSASLILISLFVWLMIDSHHKRPVITKKVQPVKTGDIAEPVKTPMSAPASTVESAVVPEPPTVRKTPLPDTRLLYEEALAAQRRKEVDVAERLYRRVLTIDAQHVEAMNNLGVLYMAQNKQDQAITLFSRAISEKKDYVDSYYNLACIYAQQNKEARSIQYLKWAIAIDEDIINWAKKDMDLKNIRESKEFNKLMEKKEK